MTVIGLLTGCSTNPPKKINSVVQEDVDKAQQKEDKYIKVTNEAADDIQKNIDSLKTLLLEMDINDLAWRNDVQYELTNIKSAVNDYALNETYLSKEQQKKYEQTISNFGEGKNQLWTITEKGWEAVEMYDKDTLGNMSSELDKANDFIKKSIKNLETERNKE